MRGLRLKQANQIAARRFKIWYPDFDTNKKHWIDREDVLFGSLRKTNKKCSCEMCRNPRRCTFTKVKERQTVQERRAATVADFE